MGYNQHLLHRKYMAFENIKAHILSRKEIDHEKDNIKLYVNIAFAGCPFVGG